MYRQFVFFSIAFKSLDEVLFLFNYLLNIETKRKNCINIQIVETSRTRKRVEESEKGGKGAGRNKTNYVVVFNKSKH